MNREALEAAVRVIHLDRHLLVLDKPSGLPTTRPDEGPCLVRAAKALSGGAELTHPSSRLDAEVSGVVVFARTRYANEALAEARRRGEYARLYLGLTGALGGDVPRRVETDIGIDPRDPRRRVVDAGRDRKRASSDLAVASKAAHATLLTLRPRTGRTHQLRVHAAHAGAPLLGDVSYGGARRVTLPSGAVARAARVMLHCARVEIPAVGGGERASFESRPPDDFIELYERLGGDAEDVARLIVSSRS